MISVTQGTLKLERIDNFPYFCEAVMDSRLKGFDCDSKAIHKFWLIYKCIQSE